ncbi:MAG: nucleotidyltransferase [Deltaproteobacteria bacterium]|nr:nucleotidyltransferase [Deltaproteobacteria bacterium]
MNDQKVEYLLIGGALAIAYGVPRLTKDVDIFLNPTIENATRCLDALRACGFGTVELTTPQDLCKTEVTIFKDIVRLDVLTRVKGIVFDAAWRNKVFLALRGVHIPAISIDDLIKTKEAAARPGDIEDIKILQMVPQGK